MGPLDQITACLAGAGLFLVMLVIAVAVGAFFSWLFAPKEKAKVNRGITEATIELDANRIAAEFARRIKFSILGHVLATTERRNAGGFPSAEADEVQGVCDAVWARAADVFIPPIPEPKG